MNLEVAPGTTEAIRLQPRGSPRQSKLFLKDWSPWEGPTLEHEEEEEEEANYHGLCATTQSPPAQGEGEIWELNQAGERGLEDVE